MKLFAHDKVLLIMTLIFAILLLTACVPSNKVAILSTPKPMIPIAVTPTATPTATPSPAPTATQIFSEERTAELTQQIYDFNHNEGNFTKEKKSEMAIASKPMNKSGITELGLQSSQPRLEGYFFDYFEKDGSLILLIGFDDKDGKGFITPVQIALYFLEGEPKSQFTFFAISDAVPFGIVETITDGDTDNLFLYLEKLKGHVIMIQPALKPIPGSKDDYNELIADYFMDKNSKIGLAGKLISEVATNNIEIRNEDYYEGSYEDYEIMHLRNIDDIDDINISKIPMLEPMMGFAG